MSEAKKVAEEMRVALGERMYFGQEPPVHPAAFVGLCRQWADRLDPPKMRLWVLHEEITGEPCDPFRYTTNTKRPGSGWIEYGPRENP